MPRKQDDENKKKKKNVLNRGEDNTEHTETKRLYTKRSNPTVPLPNEYEACSVEEASKIMPIELQIALAAYQDWIKDLTKFLKDESITITN